MWLRLCALVMGLGLACVLGGLGLAVHAQVQRLGCDPGAPCGDTAAEQRLAIEASLFGVVLSASATAGLSWGLMRLARPRVRGPPRPGLGQGGGSARTLLAPLLAPRR